MRYNQRPRLLNLMLTLSLSTVICTPSLAGDMALLSIGPRIGFSGRSPLLGKRQTESFRMADVAAVFTLPWSWPLGGEHVESGDEVDHKRWATGSGRRQRSDHDCRAGSCAERMEGTCQLRRRSGSRILRDYKFGEQDFGGPVQFVATMGVLVNPFSHAYTGFRFQHFSDAGLYGSPVSAWTCIS